MSLDHRDLHSFPTRRSSDLFDFYAFPAAGFTYKTKIVKPFFLCLGTGPLPWFWNNVFFHNCSSEFVGSERLETRHRSEEHTSELQSLRHLVCRLLLEKKKKS